MRKVSGVPFCEVVVLMVQCLVMFELVLKTVDVDGEGNGGGNRDQKNHVHLVVTNAATKMLGWW